MRISKSFVDKTTPPPPKNGKATQVFYRDSAMPGFALRITSAGAKSFVVEKRINGKVKRKTLGKYGTITTEKARKLAQEYLGKVAAGDDPIAEQKAYEVSQITLAETFEDYLLTRKNLKPSTVHDYRRHLDGSFKDWKTKCLAEISKDMVELRHRELGKRSPARANGAMRVLRALFNHAMHKYEDENGQAIIKVNPVARLQQNRAWYPLERKQTLIKAHQLKPWFEATQLLNTEVTRDYLHFTLLTGLRKSEAASLSWCDVDLLDRTFVIPDTKNNQAHTLPLSNYLMQLLEQRKAQQRNEWVFPSPLHDGHLKEPREAVSRVAELSGVPFTLHDLRRTFITIAESLDIPAYALKRLLNHKDPNDVTAGYIISHVDRLREPMQRITDFILEQAEFQM